eukprot:TRINITY_DN9620_c0_g2_i1.p1 TRINITY_DN9620_c0_g2~~TRINITY_DN9620_c0_g2_i1.p1  ORF type:complete len:505 (+),score=102.93 TRINITY_DN9620_c0_g2_i1:207-1721(+)
MEKEYKIEESATNKPRLLHRSSFTSNPTPIVSAGGNKAFRSSFSGKNSKAAFQTRGNFSSFSNALGGVQTVSYNKKPTADSIASLQEAESVSSLFKGSVSLNEPPIKSHSASKDLTKIRSMTDSGLFSTEENLKEKLEESLSPSPFRNEDPSVREKQLDNLVASSPSTTKTILLYPFYGTEQMGEGGHRVWKIALKDHIVNTLESICLIKNLPPVPNHIIEKRKLPPDTWTSNFSHNAIDKKLVAFDLDETLVHCITKDIEKADKIITVTLNADEKTKAGINIRPYAIECLKELAEYYELIVFTASHVNYANTVIDLIDPDRKIFSKRLFRNSCIQTDINLFIKDLRILGKDLRSVIIVDNSIFSFAFQLDNGVPIIPFCDDKEDKIMLKIKDYLISLKDLEDIRVINKRTFSLSELVKLDVASFIVYYLKRPSDKREELKHTPLTPTQSGESPRPEKGIQEAIEEHLGKFRESLPKYLEKEQKGGDGKEGKHNAKACLYYFNA